jgi:hypothetical protein
MSQRAFGGVRYKEWQLMPQGAYSDGGALGGASLVFYHRPPVECSARHGRHLHFNAANTPSTRPINRLCRCLAWLIEIPPSRWIQHLAAGRAPQWRPRRPPCLSVLDYYERM